MPSLTLMHFAHKAMSTASMVMLPVLPSPSFVLIDVVVCAVYTGSSNACYGFTEWSVWMGHARGTVVLVTLPTLVML